MNSRLPALQILIPFLLGVCIFYVCHLIVPITYPIILFCLSFAVFILFRFQNTFTQFTFQWINGLTTFICISCIAYSLCLVQQKSKSPIHYAQFLQDSSYVKAVIKDKLITKPKSYKTTISLLSIKNDNKQVHCKGDALAYFTQQDSMPSLKAGDVIWLKSSAIPIKNNGNPGEFDYQSFCNKKGITHQFFIRPSQFVTLSKQHFSISIYFATVRNSTLNIIKHYIPNKAAIGIAEALLVGDKADIDQDTWDAYSRTGIVHIIAISGMHMGIVYNNALLLFNLIPFFRRNKKISIAISLILMWMFALLTGMPASVMRASVMFTCIGLEKAFSEKGNSYNMLAISAIILLSYNTNWITDIGFLLSFAAVIGIMLVAKLLQQKWYVQNRLFREIINLVSATLGAQIFTMPLCLYYFHQFPLLFLLANIVAIPLTFIILYLEIGIIIFHFIVPSIAKFLGVIVSALIIWMNKLILLFGTIPHFTIFDIHISYTQLIVLMLVMIAFTYTFLYKNKTALWTTLLGLVLFWSLDIVDRWQASKQQKIIVYHMHKQSAIDCIVGHQYLPIYDSSVTPQDIKNSIQPAHILLYATSKKQLPIYEDSLFNFIQFRNKKMIVIKKQKVIFLQPIAIDYIILTKNTKTSLSQILQFTKPKLIIADGSNSLWKIDEWKKQCSDLNLRFHSTQLNGACTIDL